MQANTKKTVHELATEIYEGQQKAIKEARGERNASGQGRAGNGTGPRPKPQHTGALGQHGGKRTRKGIRKGTRKIHKLRKY